MTWIARLIRDNSPPDATFARHYQEKARELSDLRQQAASGLASAVEQEIQRLGMPGVRFTIELRCRGSAGQERPGQRRGGWMYDGCDIGA